ncbi:MAG: hypothetical protein Q9186_002048 [Xanthomendoza sp. 1 TL-2023]
MPLNHWPDRVLLDKRHPNELQAHARKLHQDFVRIKTASKGRKNIPRDTLFKHLQHSFTALHQKLLLHPQTIHIVRPAPSGRHAQHDAQSSGEPSDGEESSNSEDSSESDELIESEGSSRRDDSDPPSTVYIPIEHDVAAIRLRELSAWEILDRIRKAIVEANSSLEKNASTAWVTAVRLVINRGLEISTDTRDHGIALSSITSWQAILIENIIQEGVQQGYIFDVTLYDAKPQNFPHPEGEGTQLGMADELFEGNKARIELLKERTALSSVEVHRTDGLTAALVVSVRTPQLANEIIKKGLRAYVRAQLEEMIGKLGSLYGTEIGSGPIQSQQQTQRHAFTPGITKIGALTTELVRDGANMQKKTTASSNLGEQIPKIPTGPRNMFHYVPTGPRNMFPPIPTGPRHQVLQMLSTRIRSPPVTKFLGNHISSTQVDVKSPPIKRPLAPPQGRPTKKAKRAKHGESK